MGWRRRLRRLVMGPTAILALYAAVALNPSLLFAHELTVKNVTLHSRAPLPPEALTVLAEAQRRVAESPFHQADQHFDVFLCDTPACFAFFVPWNANVGGVSLTGLSGNVFLRPADVARDRLIGPNGAPVPGVRTFTYFVAHELTHSAMSRRLGRWRYHQLDPWQREGIAELVGKAGAFDFEAERARFRAGDPTLDPAASGLYLRYQLEVELLLREGQSLEAVASGTFDHAALDARLRATDP